MAASDGPRIITDGLVFAVDAADRNSYTSGSNTWYDWSGNGNNGTLTNGPTFDEANGGSIVFDGTDDEIVVFAPSLKWQNWDSITIECAFKFDTLVGGVNGRQYVFDFRQSGGTNGAIGFFHDNNVNPNGLKLFYSVGSPTYEEPLITTINAGEIIFYQVTFNKTASTNNIRHYVNGTNYLNRSINITTTTINSGNNIYLGGYSGNSYAMNGNIYLFRAYPNKLLSEQEITQNYNALKSRFNL